MIAMNLHAKTRTRKGQSAIEYLTTYGWALLAIIVVGAVLVNMGIFDQCQTNQPQFAGQQVALDGWAWTASDSMDLDVRAINADVNISQVSFDWDQDGSYTGSADDQVSISPEVQINDGGLQTVTVSGLTGVDSGECAVGAMQITYDLQDGSSTGRLATGSGTIRGPVP